jgi:hypothetical protein
MYALAQNQYIAECEHFDVTSDNDMEKFTETQKWYKEQYYGKEGTGGGQLDLMTAQIGALTQGTKDAQVSAQLSNILAIVKSPEFRNEIDAAGLGDSLASVMESAMAMVASGDPSQMPTLKDLTDGIKKTVEDQKTVNKNRISNQKPIYDRLEPSADVGYYVDPVTNKTYTEVERNALLE